MIPSTAARDRKRRRSSILKKSPSRTALLDLDTNTDTTTDNGEKAEAHLPSKRRLSKRVSFADTNQIKEICRASDIANDWRDNSDCADTTRLNNVANLMAPIPKRDSLALPPGAAPGNVKNLQSLLTLPIVDSDHPNNTTCDMDMTNVSIAGGEHKIEEYGQSAASMKASFASFFDNTQLGIGELYIPSSQESPLSTSTEEQVPCTSEVQATETVQVESSQTMGMQDFLSSIGQESGPGTELGLRPAPSTERKHPDINPPSYKQCVGQSRLSTLPENLLASLPLSDEKHAPHEPLPDVTRVFSRDCEGEMEFTECFNGAPSSHENVDAEKSISVGTDIITTSGVQYVPKQPPLTGQMSNSPEPSSEVTKIFGAVSEANMDMTLVRPAGEQPGCVIATNDGLKNIEPENTKIFSPSVASEMELTCTTGIALSGSTSINGDNSVWHRNSDVDHTKLFGSSGMDVTCNLGGTLERNEPPMSEGEKTQVMYPGCDDMELTLAVPLKRSAETDINPDVTSNGPKCSKSDEISFDAVSPRPVQSPTQGEESNGRPLFLLETADSDDYNILVCDTQPDPPSNSGRNEGNEDAFESDLVDETILNSQPIENPALADDDTGVEPPRRRSKISKVRNSIAVYKLRHEKARHVETTSESTTAEILQETPASDPRSAVEVSVLYDEDYDVSNKDICLGGANLVGEDAELGVVLSQREDAVEDELQGANRHTDITAGDPTLENMITTGPTVQDYDVPLSQAQAPNLPSLDGYGSENELRVQDGKIPFPGNIPEIREQPCSFGMPSLFEDGPKVNVTDIHEIVSTFATQPWNQLDEEPLDEMTIMNVRGGVSGFSSPSSESQSATRSDTGDMEVESLPTAEDCLSDGGDSAKENVDINSERQKVDTGDSDLKKSEFSDGADKKDYFSDECSGQQNETEEKVVLGSVRSASMNAEEAMLVDDSGHDKAKKSKEVGESLVKDSGHDQAEKSKEVAEALLKEMREVNLRLKELISNEKNREEPPTKLQLQEFEKNSEELEELDAGISKLQADKREADVTRTRFIAKQKDVLDKVLNDLDIEEKGKQRLAALSDSLKKHQKYLQWTLRVRTASTLEFAFLSETLLLSVDFIEDLPDAVGPSCQTKINSLSLQSNISTDCVVSADAELYRLAHKLIFQQVDVPSLSETYPDFSSLQMALRRFSLQSLAAEELIEDVDWISCQVAFCSCDVSVDESCITVTFLPPMVGVDRFQVKFFYKEQAALLEKDASTLFNSYESFVPTSHEYIAGRRQLDHLGEKDVCGLLAAFGKGRHYLRSVVEAILEKLDHKKVDQKLL